MPCRPRPPFSRAAVDYALDELLRRAGFPDARRQLISTIDIRYEAIPERDSAAASPPAIRIEPCAPEAVDDLISAPPASIEWLDQSELPERAGASIDGRLPVLFRGASFAAGTPFAIRRGTSIVVTVDVVATALFALSRIEEYDSIATDEHGRATASASVALRQGFLDRPIVDEYADLFGALLEDIVPGIARDRLQRSFHVRVSHDIDRLADLTSAAHLVRSCGGDLFKRRSPARAALRIAQALRQRFAPQRSAEFRAVEEIAAWTRAQGVEDETFFFLASPPGGRNGDYDITWPHVRELVTRLRASGFEIGLHGSYEASGDALRLAAETDVLRRVSGCSAIGGRHHYLRFRVPETWRIAEGVGLRYDSTLGYADHEGFRCGTAIPYRPFDLELDRVLRVLEVPLICMDVTLLVHRGYTSREAVARARALIDRCRRAGGDFTLLWHNSSIIGERRAWRDVYRAILAAAMERDDAGATELQCEALAGR